MNDMIQILVSAHGRIQALLEATKNTASLPAKSESFVELTRHFYLHEEIESEAFFALEALPLNGGIRGLTRDFERTHEYLWSLLQTASKAVDAGDEESARGAFGRLEAAMRSHIADQEANLFPKIRALIPSCLLGKLAEHVQGVCGDAHGGGGEAALVVRP